VHSEQIPGKARDILIVDDDAVQMLVFRHLLQQLGCEHRCHSAENGLEALQFLRRQGAYGKAPKPELIILDLNMPGMNGCEVLVEIKRDPELRSIPVIMFSLCIDPKDVSRCYSEHANAYVQKPPDYQTTLKVVEQIERFWLQTATLPASSPPASTTR